jgi:4-amino-4-deoxy-L-arabinose transferase-like glycosyltransferase
MARGGSIAWYAALGALCGYATLVRTQFLFFLPLTCIVLVIADRAAWKEVATKSLASLGLLVIIVGTWGLYVERHIGHIALTEGRQELVLNIRATRAKLSYPELTRYAFEWIQRSLTGGAHFALLDANEAKGITQRYYAVATSSALIQKIKQENLHTIITHSGHYLYGNLIEVMKTAYIEHDYTDSQSRYFRPILYALLYAFFVFGLIQTIRYSTLKDMRRLVLIALLFPAYNFFILSFFDTVPRFNTPFLLFYIVVGCVGLVLWRRARIATP